MSKREPLTVGSDAYRAAMARRWWLAIGGGIVILVVAAFVFDRNGLVPRFVIWLVQYTLGLRPE